VVKRQASNRKARIAPLVVVLLGVAALSAQDKSKVHINRTVPAVTPPPMMPVFSDPPTSTEIMRARVFEEPLLPVGAEPSTEENRELARLLTAYLDAGVPDGTQALEAFATHASSPWRASLLTDLGLVWRRTGHFTKAYKAWELAWQLAKGEADERGHKVADKALGEFVELSARLGHFDELMTLFQEIEGRGIRGAAAEKVSGAKQAVWLMDNEPGRSFRCGPLGLDAVLRAGRASYETPKAIQMCLSTKRGTSLVAMRDLAKEVGVSMVMGMRTPGASVVVPALVHWGIGHFAALVEQQGDRYRVQDPTFGNELWVSRATLDEEASGYFLIRSQALPDGWRAIADVEGSGVWGKGNPAGIDATDLGPYPCPVGPPCCGNPTCGGPPSGYGMPVMGIHLMQVALSVTDIAIWYTPPKGPAVEFRLSYNQRDILQPQEFYYANVGPRWTTNWVAYLTDDPSNPAAPLTLFQPGGGAETITSYNAATQSYSPTIRAQAVITRTSTSPITYARELPDGSVEIFGVSDGAAWPRHVFLSEIRDPQGNALTFTYDSQLRLVAVTDAIGQVTTLGYEGPTSNRITQVTDPFGRTATITYSGQGIGGIGSVTDMLGLTSTFEYNPIGAQPSPSAGSLKSMTTPYGTTTATVGEAYLTRWAEIRDPLGGRERAEYASLADIGEPVPTGMPAALPDHHHDTVYWDKRAMATGAGDTSAAIDYNWTLSNMGGFQAAAVPQSVKRPLTNRVYYSYQGGNWQTEGSVRQVTGIGRVLDNGTSQVWTRAYNTRGRITQAIDPLGRETDYVYATNNLDLIQVKQKRGGTWDILETRTYNSQHEPLTITDAAGQTTTYTYNAAGQVLTVTNPRNETTTYAYDANGYLLSVTGAMAGATTTLGYDGYGRLNSVTDSEAYHVTATYDIANRPVQLAYPDGTTEQTTYDRLDVRQQRDRLGRLTTFTYDATRRLTAVRDPLGRRVAQEWCVCGTLDALIDGAGNRTRWDRDLEGRVITETRADGSATHYTYENTTARLKQLTDRKGQATTYDYFLDNAFKQKAYTNTSVATATVSATYDATYPRLATITDGTGTTSYAYLTVTSGQLGAGQLASIDGPLTNDTITYNYDELGRVASRSINAVSQSTAYDPLGRVAGVTNVLGTFAYAYVGNSGRLSSVTYPNSQTSTYSYFGHTGNDRLQTILHQRADTTTISRFDYTYDTVGNIAGWTRQADASAATQYVFGYDAADQIRSATKLTTGGTPTVLARYQYAYDLAGNRTSEQIDDAVTGATYNNVNQLVNTQPSGGMYLSGTVSEPSSVTVAGQPALVAADNTFAKTVPLSVGTNTIAITATDPSGNASTKSYQVTTSGSSATLTYDANGNLTSDGTRTLTWDAENRLISVTIGTHTSTFTYDGLDRRVGIVEADNGSTTSDTKFVWCELGLCEVRDSGGTTVTKRYFENGVQDGGIAYFYTRDHLGSVREVTDGLGAARARYDYDSWGRRTKISGDRDVEIGYTGYYQHVSSGLELAPLRAFDPALRRWISEDPIGLAAGTDRYAYVGNSPSGRIDPLGLDWLQNLSNFISGAVYTYAGNLTEPINNALGNSSVIDKCSAAYRAGATTTNLLLLAAVLAGGGNAGTLEEGAGNGLGNPFKGKTPAEIDAMFKTKGFDPRGPDRLNGKGGYVNPETGRSYHIDEANSYGEPPHVDVNRPRTYDGPLGKKKYPF
jgi:RHS repeat-associated protein